MEGGGDTTTNEKATDLGFRECLRKAVERLDYEQENFEWQEKEEDIPMDELGRWPASIPDEKEEPVQDSEGTTHWSRSWG